jgi:ribosome recycling factor
METNTILQKMRDDMKKAVDHTLHEFSTVHTGKATPNMLDGVTVNAYGSSVKLREVAAISTPDSRTISIQPWDRSIARDVEKAIIDANLGFNPIADGGIIRIPIPELTGERRQSLVKTCHGMAEEGRIRLRQIRRDAIDSLKAASKEGLSEDEQKRGEKEVQKETDRFVEEINQHLTHKEADLKRV